MTKIKIDYILKIIILLLSLLLVIFILWRPFSREGLSDMDEMKLKAELEILDNIVLKSGNPTDNPSNLLNIQYLGDAKLNKDKGNINVFCNTDDYNSNLDPNFYKSSSFSYCANGKKFGKNQYGPGEYNILVPPDATSMSFILVGGGGGGGVGGWGPDHGNGIGGGGGGQGAILIMSRVPLDSSVKTILLTVGSGGAGGIKKVESIQNIINSVNSGQRGGATSIKYTNLKFIAGGGFGGIAGIPTDQGENYSFYGIGGMMGIVQIQNSFSQYIHLNLGASHYSLNERRTPIGDGSGNGQTTENNRWEDGGSMPGSDGGHGGPITPYTITGSDDIPIWATVLGKVGTPWPSDNYGYPYKNDPSSFYQGIGGGPGAGGGGGGGSIHNYTGDFGANGCDGVAYLTFF